MLGRLHWLVADSGIDVAMMNW